MRVIVQSHAGEPRHPASLTKLMTLYTAFSALAEGHLATDTVLTVSAKAASQGGARLGMAAGQTLPLREAFLSIIARSANDAAMALAEQVGGSEQAFARLMNIQAARLGMTGSHFLNPTGMTAPGHVSTARDMALLGLALKRDFPQFWPLFATRSMQWRGHTLPTINGFLVAQAGANGLKTGFTCPAGYNLVASADRNGQAVLVVVMGAASKQERLARAQGLTREALQAPSPDGNIRLTALPNQPGSVPDLRHTVCGLSIPGEEAPIPLPRNPGFTPKGWGMEVAFGLRPSLVKRDLERTYTALKADLGGGRMVVITRPFDGGLRYRGLIIGLSQDRAILNCQKLRREDEERCLTLTPEMVQGAFEDEQLWRMLAAR